MPLTLRSFGREWVWQLGKMVCAWKLQLQHAAALVHEAKVEWCVLFQVYVGQYGFVCQQGALYHMKACDTWDGNMGCCRISLRQTIPIFHCRHSHRWNFGCYGTHHAQEKMFVISYITSCQSFPLYNTIQHPHVCLLLHPKLFGHFWGPAAGIGGNVTTFTMDDGDDDAWQRWRPHITPRTVEV